MITLPASRTAGGGYLYVKAVQNLVDLAAARGVSRVIFTGSTAVYGNQTGKLTENSQVDPVTESAKAIVEIEHWLNELRVFQRIFCVWPGWWGIPSCRAFPCG